MPVLQIATNNISRISSPDRRLLLLNYCLDNRFDLVALQEVSLASCPILERSYRLISNPGVNKLGTAILARPDLEILDVQNDPDGRVVAARFRDFSIYAPSGKRHREEIATFFRVILPAVVWCPTPVLLAGDFNSDDDLADRTRPTAEKKSALVNRTLGEMVSGLGLCDMWRELRKGQAGYSFFHQRGSARLDRIYSSASLLDLLSDIDIIPSSVSDHFALILPRPSSETTHENSAEHLETQY